MLRSGARAVDGGRQDVHALGAHSIKTIPMPIILPEGLASAAIAAVRWHRSAAPVLSGVRLSGPTRSARLSLWCFPGSARPAMKLRKCTRARANTRRLRREDARAVRRSRLSRRASAAETSRPIAIGAGVLITRGKFAMIFTGGLRARREPQGKRREHHQQGRDAEPQNDACRRSQVRSGLPAPQAEAKIARDFGLPQVVIESSRAERGRSIQRIPGVAGLVRRTKSARDFIRVHRQ